MTSRVLDGYRDGVDAGKEASLQRGFNIGYQEGAEQMVTIGQLKGVLCALQCWSQLEHPGSPTFSSISRLLQEVLRQEEDMIKRMKTGMAQQQPPASINDITEAVEDMGMEHTDAGCGGSSCSDKGCCGKGQSPDGSSTVLQTPCQSSTQASCSSDSSVEQLLNCCVDLVAELGLPQELLHHLQQLRNRSP
ncbi:hypothetical protein GJAV_G00070900 [Gymnothorax javanicus]|nr:hypothetical protein GJAV_G00070900 [Gymnothorax javanicus]